MRVAMLTYSTRPRGGVVHALKLAERLRALGVDITLYSLARKDDPLVSSGYFRRVSVPYKIFQYEWHPELITRLESMIDAYSVGLPKDMDIYHAQDCVGGTALARIRANGDLPAPVFRTIHHVDDFAEPRLFEFEKRAVAHADFRFVVSEYWQKVLKDEYGYTSLISYNGIDVSDFSPLPARKSSAPTVLFVGGLEPRKGLEFLVRAMKTIIKELPGARLIAIAKTGFRGVDEVGSFRSLSEELGVADRINFRESISQEELLQCYSESDLLAMPSRTEGWGLALMEAMACGRPVVASRVGGIPELVRDGLDGILVDAGDVDALARAIVRLLKNPELRTKMGAAGAKRVREFSWDSTARVVLDAYEEALVRSLSTRS